MPHPSGNPESKGTVSLAPASGGWHCSHFYYSFDREALRNMSADDLARGREDFAATLDPTADEAPIRLQTSIISGHKADFGLMVLDPDPLKVDRVHQKLLAGGLGPALKTTFSFVSITEISEYVLSVEDYGRRLSTGGEEPGSSSYEAKMATYAQRSEAMNRQRLTPDFPTFRSTCFYPMNKRRDPRQNWFLLPKSERDRLMIEHARSGIAFAGKVTQLITVAIGLENWEWGVTLWGDNPEYLKQIVYRMRFDEASARYADFGPFFAGYVAGPQDILDHCFVGN